MLRDVAARKVSASWILVGAWLVAGCTCKSNGEKREDVRPKQIILICLDTLRADRLEAYGYQRKTSPTLAALARESVTFTTVGAQASHTLPSLKSFFAAKYPLRLIQERTFADLASLSGVGDLRGFIIGALGDLEGQSIVPRLKGLGYRTAAFTGGAWVSRALGFDEGFDLFNDEGRQFEAILPRVFPWLSDNAGASFFLFVHAYDVHAPYHCREPYNSRFCESHPDHLALESKMNIDLIKHHLTAVDRRAISDHYDGGIASADAYIGTFLSKLRELKIYEEALIIFMSDHGESLEERDYPGHGRLYPEQLLVPLIIKFPASMGMSPVKIEEPAELVDVMPTVLDLLDLPLPANIDGRSLLPVIKKAKKGRRYLVAQTSNHRSPQKRAQRPLERAIMVPGRWLLIHDARASTFEMFDLRRDPPGLVDIAAKEITHRGSLFRQLKAHDPPRSTGRLREVKRRRLGKQLRRQIQSLGYIEP